MRFIGSRKKNRITTGQRGPLRARKPQVDLLEGRALLSTLTVTSASDNGPGSLRQAIVAASSGDKIVFARALYGSTIKLTSSELLINKSLDIEGPGSESLTISAGGKNRVVEMIGASTDVKMAGLTLRDGNASQGGGGGIDDTAHSLTLTDVRLQNNTATGNKSIPALGGGLFAQDSAVTLSNVYLVKNQAISDHGFAAGGGADVQGGSLTITDSVFDQNVAQGGVTPNGPHFKGLNGLDASGGGLAYTADQALPSQLTITGSYFENNQALAGDANAGGIGGRAFGGGVSIDEIAASNPAVFMSSDQLLSNNTKGGFGNGGQGGDANGGGLYLTADQSTNASLWLQKMVVDKNIAQSGDGGATAFKTGNAGNATGGGMDFDAGTAVSPQFNLYTTTLTNNKAGDAISGDGGMGGSADAGGLMNEANHASHPIFSRFSDTFHNNTANGGRGGIGASMQPFGMFPSALGKGGSGGSATAGAVEDMARLAVEPAFVDDFGQLIGNGAVGGTGGQGGNVANVTKAADGGIGGQATAGGLDSEATASEGTQFNYMGETIQYNWAIAGDGGNAGTGGANTAGGRGGDGNSAYGGGLNFLGGPVNNLTYTLSQSTVASNYAGGGFGGKGGQGMTDGGNGGNGGAAFGAGISIDGGAAGYTDQVMVDYVTDSGNVALAGAGGDGGASLYNGNNAQWYAAGNGGNGGSSWGAGVYDAYDGNLNLQHSRITGNSAYGGVFGVAGTGIQDNWASNGSVGVGIGGGVCIVLPPGQSAFSFDTAITGNKADIDPDVYGNLQVI